MRVDFRGPPSLIRRRRQPIGQKTDAIVAELSRSAAIALAIRISKSSEIARAFLADDTAIAQWLVRAKRQIRDRRLTLEMPRGSGLRRIDSANASDGFRCFAFGQHYPESACSLKSSS